jgi:hypothetical protein
MTITRKARGVEIPRQAQWMEPGDGIDEQELRDELTGSKLLGLHRS